MDRVCAIGERCWHFTADAAELAVVRRFAAAECAARGIPGEAAEAVVLAVDELAANARRYGPFELRRYDDPFGFGVVDGCPVGADEVARCLRRIWPDEAAAEAGRGLLIVGSLFPGCQVYSATLRDGADGKEIRFTIPDASC